MLSAANCMPRELQRLRLAGYRPQTTSRQPLAASPDSRARQAGTAEVRAQMVGEEPKLYPYVT